MKISVSILNTKDKEKAIKTLNVFGQVNKYGLNKEIIEKSLIDLKPREDRYSIVNRYENKLNERYKILKKLYKIKSHEKMLMEYQHRKAKNITRKQ